MASARRRRPVFRWAFAGVFGERPPRMAVGKGLKNKKETVGKGVIRGALLNQTCKGSVQFCFRETSGGPVSLLGTQPLRP